MRVLFTCVPGYGHFHPMAPIAQALGAKGHEVAFATSERFCPRVTEAGFRTFAAGLGPGQVVDRTLELPGVAGPGPEETWRFGAQMFAAVAAPAKVGDLFGVLDEWQPDLLINDVTDFAGPVAAAHAGIVCVAHSLGPLFPLELYRLGAELAAPLWEAVGKRPGPFGGMFGSMYLDICPPSLQSAEIDEVGAVLAPMRPIAFDAVGDEALPPWIEELAPQPTVYVTLGTLDNNAPGVIEAVVDGLRGERMNVVVTVGPRRDPQELGPQPPNVRVERYIPQSQLLPHCDAVVAHGGSGTMLAALAHGLPMLVLPQAANQFWNAERCAALGAAIRLFATEVDAGSVRRAVTALLDQPIYRDRARTLAGEIDRLPAPSALVTSLETLVGRSS